MTSPKPRRSHFICGSAFIRPTHADVLSQIILRIMELFVKGDSVTVKLWKQVLSTDSFRGEHSILKGALARYPSSNNLSHPNGGLCCAQTHLMDFQASHIKLKERDRQISTWAFKFSEVGSGASADELDIGIFERICQYVLPIGYCTNWR